MSDSNNTLKTINQCAEILNCHPNTIRNLIKAKKLPAQRIGRNMIRIYLADLLAVATPYQGGEFGIWS
jgi:excisionase family DNA binding protein